MAAMALAIFSPVFVSISLLRSMASFVSKSSRLLKVPLENPSSSASLSVIVKSSPSFTRILGEPQNFFSALSRFSVTFFCSSIRSMTGFALVERGIKFEHFKFWRDERGGQEFRIVVTLG